MRQILFVKYNRTRAAQFQLKTEIVREDEVLTVEKTALTEAGEAHIRSFGEKYEKIRDLNPAIRFLKPEWKKDKKTVSFQYLNGKTVGDALGEAIVMGEVPYQELETVMKVLFPEIDALFGVPAPAKWHPEIDTGVHTLMTLSMAAMLSPDVDVRFSTLCHDLGKGLTPKELWPRHHGHGPAGVKLVEGLCQRLRVPNEIRDLAKLVAEFHDLIHTFPILKPATIVKLFDNIDAWRKPQRVEQIALTSEADVRGRTGFEACDYPQGRLLRKAWEVAKAVPTKDVVEAGFKGPDIREELTKRRIQAVSEWKEKHCPQPKD